MCSFGEHKRNKEESKCVQTENVCVASENRRGEKKKNLNTQKEKMCVLLWRTKEEGRRRRTLSVFRYCTQDSVRKILSHKIVA